MSDALLELHIERALYAIDSGAIHAMWFGRLIRRGHDEMALQSFDRFVTLVRHAETEIAHLRIAQKDKRDFGQAAGEYRRDRELSAKLRRAKAQGVSSQSERQIPVRQAGASRQMETAE